MKPGVLNVGTTEPHRTKLNLGGYPQIKFRPLTFDQIDWGNRIQICLLSVMPRFC